MRGIAGLLNPGKPFTTLANEVVGVRRIVCEGRELERRSILAVNDAKVEGRPSRFSIIGRRVYIWPIPDRPYRADFEWDGIPQLDDKAFDCSPQWLLLYETELNRIRKSA